MPYCAAEHLSEQDKATALFGADRQKCDAVVVSVPWTVANYSPHSDGVITVLKFEFELQLVTHSELNPGKEGHSTFIHFGSNGGQCRDVPVSVHRDANRHLEPIPGPPTYGRGLLLIHGTDANHHMSAEQITEVLRILTLPHMTISKELLGG
jgi:hypothetical protein